MTDNRSDIWTTILNAIPAKWRQPRYLIGVGAALVVIATLAVALRDRPSPEKPDAPEIAYPVPDEMPSGPDEISDINAQHPDVSTDRDVSERRIQETRHAPIGVRPRLPEGRTSTARAEQFHNAFAELLPREMRRMGFRPDLVTQQPAIGDGPVRWHIRVPRDFPLVRVNAVVASIASDAGGEVYWSEQDSTNLSMVHMFVGSGNVATDLVTLHRQRRMRFRGTIAIIIDDVGYRPALGTMDFINLPQSVTLAILPNHNGSAARIARLARELGQDVMLHLPMEPSNDAIPLEPKTILTSMDDRRIRALTEEHIKSIPGIVGVNNHMGSRATEDERVMNAVMDAVKRHGLFFLDSRTSAQTVAQKVAHERGVLTGSRNVFLDNDKETERVIEKIYDAARLAERDGVVIAIGHDRDETYKALARTLPDLERRGFRIAPVRELMR